MIRVTVAPKEATQGTVVVTALFFGFMEVDKERTAGALATKAGRFAVDTEIFRIISEH